MLMQVKLLSIIIITVIVSITISVICISRSNAENCRLEEGKISIVINGVDGAYLITWVGDSIAKHETSFHFIESNEKLTNVFKGSGDKRSISLPQNLLGANFRFDVPYAVSDNKKTLIATIYPDRVALVPSEELAIIDLVSNKIVGKIKTERQILSLIWSPNQKYISVLLRENVTDQKWKGPRHWFYKILGHPISYNNLLLRIYNRDGQLICSKTIAENLEQGRGYIVEWSK